MDREMLHRIDVMAGADALFRAITTSEGLAAFWTPASQAEPEVGSVAVFKFPQAPVDLKMRVDELDEPRRVAWSCLGDFPFSGGTRIIWELGEGPQGGTKVVFRHTGWPKDYPDDEFGSVNYTWGLVVGALKAYAETGKPKPALP